MRCTGYTNIQTASIFTQAMTNREWILAMAGRLNVSEQDVELIMLNQNLDPEAEVNVNEAKRALCKEFATIIPMANVSEGGYSITWNMEGIKIWYKQMCNELGIEAVGLPRIQNASNRW